MRLQLLMVLGCTLFGGMPLLLLIPALNSKRRWSYHPVNPSPAHRLSNHPCDSSSSFSACLLCHFMFSVFNVFIHAFNDYIAILAAICYFHSTIYFPRKIYPGGGGRCRAGSEREITLSLHPFHRKIPAISPLFRHYLNCYFWSMILPLLAFIFDAFLFYYASSSRFPFTLPFTTRLPSEFLQKL